MKFVSHRGNLTGKEIENENTIKQIEKAINLGFDVEVDVWKVNGQIYLGHDKPENKIDISFLLKNIDWLWIHAKNFDIVSVLVYNDLHWFWHENDKFTLTSKNKIWTFLDVFIENAVVNQPNDNSIFWTQKLYKKYNFYAICHDNIIKCKNILQ